MKIVKLTSLILLLTFSKFYAQWTELNSGTTKLLNSVFFINQNIGFVVGAQSTVLKTTDRGVTWIVSNSGITPNFTLSSTYFLNELIGIITGYNPTNSASKVFRTTNGGNSWYEVFNNSTSNSIESITFINNTGFFCCGNTIYKTSDGGINWTPIFSGITNYIYSIQFIDSNNGFACGTSGSFIKTTNGGSTWISKPLSFNYWLSEVQFLDNNNGYIAAYHDFFKTSNGGESWSSIRPSDIDLKTLFFTDVNTGFTGGYHGQVYKTTNGGSSWVGAATNSNNYIYSLYFIDSNTGYACGEGGKISRYANKVITLSAPNGGESWLVGSYQNIVWSIVNIDNVKIQYSTNGGTSWITIVDSYPATNGSYSWQIPNTVSNNCKVKILDANNSSIFDLSDNSFSIIPSIIVTSPNGGEQWTVGTIKNISWQSQNISNLNIEYTTNNGSTWLPISATIVGNIGNYSWTVPNTISTQCKIKITDSSNPNNYDLSDQMFSIIPAPAINILIPNGGEQWDVGLLKNIYFYYQSIQYVKIEYSTNNGVDWQLIINNYPANSSYSWLVPNTPSNFCKIKITDEANQNVFDISDSTFEIVPVYWFPQISNIYSILNDVKFLDYSYGYICGQSGNFLKTTNGGLNWSVVPIGITTNLNSIFFINTNLGWATGDNGLIIKTINGGLSWTFQNSTTTQKLNSVFFKSDLVGWAIGNNGTVLKTSNGGDNWTSQLSGINNTLKKIFLYSLTDGWIVGESGTYLKTTNGGTNWNRQTVGITNDLNSVFFSTNYHGCIVASGGKILFSTDGGNIWANSSSNSYENLYSVHFPTIDIGYSSGENGLILKTTDNGVNWFRLGTGITSTLNCIYFIDSYRGYAVGNEGKILNTNNGGMVFLEEEKIDKMPKEFLITQNYPNPFNPQTTITYSIKSTCLVTIKTYDILGHEIETLVSEEKPIGIFQTTWNAKNLPSGVYFYTLQAGDFVQTKKMILLR